MLTLILSDPATRNSMSAEMAAELSAEIDRFEGASDLRVLLVTGRDPAFCSGANVRRMSEANLERVPERLEGYVVKKEVTGVPRPRRDPEG